MTEVIVRIASKRIVADNVDRDMGHPRSGGCCSKCERDDRPKSDAHPSRFDALGTPPTHKERADRTIGSLGFLYEKVSVTTARSRPYPRPTLLGPRRTATSERRSTSRRS